MTIRIYERDFEGHTLHSHYEDFEGSSAAGVVQAMREKDIFDETHSVSEYVHLLSQRVCSEFGVQFTPEGGTVEGKHSGSGALQLGSAAEPRE